MATCAHSAASVKIMLVDDEEEFVHTLAERLETRGLEPSVAYDGEQALAMVQEEEPEIMVLDLRMPGMHGMEVLRCVKRDHPSVQVIILTGHGSGADQELAVELGAAAYLQKPVNLDALMDAMKAAYVKSKGRPWPGERG
jgi:DNA-binding response OmpR family regulator